MVFFAWNSAALTPEARHTIMLAAHNSMDSNTITLRGFSDTSGSPSYNLQLSLNRARTVATLLIADDVPANRIAIRAYGATHLPIPTAPDIRQPQNRRVEIIQASPRTPGRRAGPEA